MRLVGIAAAWVAGMVAALEWDLYLPWSCYCWRQPYWATCCGAGQAQCGRPFWPP